MSYFSFNGLFVKIFVEVDMRFPVKKVMIVNRDEDNPISSVMKSYLKCAFTWV